MANKICGNHHRFSHVGDNLVKQSLWGMVITHNPTAVTPFAAGETNSGSNCAHRRRADHATSRRGVSTEKDNAHPRRETGSAMANRICAKANGPPALGSLEILATVCQSSRLPYQR